MVFFSVRVFLSFSLLLSFSLSLTCLYQSSKDCCVDVRGARGACRGEGKSGLCE